MKAFFYSLIALFFFSCHSNIGSNTGSNQPKVKPANEKIQVIPFTANRPGDDAEYEERNKFDSLLAVKFDSLTAGWVDIKPANPDIYFQRQYAGLINNKPSVFNVNLRAINVRGEKDITIWAAIGDTLTNIYCSEDAIFGTNDKIGNLPICRGCRRDSLALYKKTYIPGYEDERLTCALRFNPDSTTIEGFYYNAAEAEIVHFALQQLSPSLALNYIVYRYHKHAKWTGTEVAEVPATIVLGIDMPDKMNPDYEKFLSVRTNGKNVETTARYYMKDFQSKLKKSHIPWSRSMIGDYTNDEIIYNQQNWVVFKTENVEGDADYYGEMGYDYECFDNIQHRFISDTDIFIDNYIDSANYEKLKRLFNRESGLKDYAFVCPQGVVFKTSGNHGWEVGIAFTRWQQILPFIKPDFIKQHPYWFKK